MLSLSDPQTWVSLAMLTALELVLGIDNLIFIVVLTGRLPLRRQGPARQVGLALATITRIALLASIVWIIGLTRPVFELLDRPISWRDLILIAGGLFLLWKGTWEIHHAVEGAADRPRPERAKPSFAKVLAQIVALDLVFSLDSVITAVGIGSRLWVMIVAIVVAVAAMIAASASLSAFIERHPTVRMLALSFLLLIGMTLIADGAGFEVPKGYVYVAIAFSIGVEILNQMAARARRSGRRGRNEPQAPH